ncbi:MAG: DnaA regulatory inactivator Hda [Burkholderiales bacterium]|nr:DnaA regulatory inactivator Hda [Burkholderiales bacterium]
MEQLTFDLAAAEAPSFANFVAGSNAEAVAALARVAAGEMAETAVLVWGPPGAGRTHLLRASVAAAGPDRHAEFHADAASAPAEPPEPGALVAVDDVDRADPAAQARLFTLFNGLQATGGQLLAAAAVPPSRLPLRDDLRTRLGWGLVYEVAPLADADKPAALARFAAERGFRLGDDVIAYLLAHGRRDMPSLVATLTALDRFALAGKRQVTVPLLREWLQQEIALRPRAP